MRGEIVSRGVPPDRVVVVPNARRRDVPRTGSRRLARSGPVARHRARRRHRAACVSSLVGYEGVATLLSAVRRLADDGAPVRGLIVGDGPERAALEEQARALGLGDTVIFTGRVPFSAVRDYHAALDVFCRPTGRRSGHPAGDPAQAARGHGLRPAGGRQRGWPALEEIVEDGVTGLFAPEPGGPDVVGPAETACVPLWAPRPRWGSSSEPREGGPHAFSTSALGPAPWSAATSPPMPALGVDHAEPPPPERPFMDLVVHRPRLRRAAAGPGGDPRRAERRRLRRQAAASSTASTPAAPTSTTCPTPTSPTWWRAGSAPPPTRPAVGRGRRRGDLRADPAVRGRRPRPARGRTRRRPTSAAHLHPGHAGRARVDDLPRHHRRGGPPAPRGRRAGGGRRLPPRLLAPSGSTRATRRTACATPPRSSAATRRRAPRRAAAFYGRFVDTVVRGQGHPRGRDGQAAREHLPPRQHRPGQRDGAVLPRARHRPLGRHRLRARPSRSASRRSTPARASAVTASRSTRTTSSYNVRRSSATRSGSSSWPRRSTPDARLRRHRVQDLLNDAAQAAPGLAVLLLGVTYKPDIADQRESPAKPLAQQLLARGADVSYHDPHVTDWQVDGRDIPRADDGAAAAADVTCCCRTTPSTTWTPSRRTRACCSTPVARFPENRFTRSKASPGETPGPL